MTELTLIPLAQAHTDLIFQWRNDPYLIALGSSNRPVEREEHVAWITNAIDNPDRKIFIIQSDGVAVGQLRFDRNENPAHCVVSIYILQQVSGRGIGVQALEQGCALIKTIWQELDKIVAYILKSNKISQKAFLKAGFRYDTEIAGDEKHEIFSLRPGEAISHSKICFDGDEIEAVTTTIKSGYWAQGSRVKLLEDTLTNITGAAHAVAVSSGLSALRIALLAVGVQPGDEVIVPAYSCVALANAVLAVHAIPVAADISLSGFNITKEEAEKHISDKTRAIIAVHTFGALAPIASLKTLGLPVIEDCAHALGISTEQGAAGSLGDVAICSFYATKLVGGGEGGAVLTNSQNIAAAALDLRDYTDKAASAIHLNEKMSDIHAAVSQVQLQKLPFFIKKRKGIAEHYHAAFSKYRSISLQQNNELYYRFVLRFERDVEDLLSVLEDHGIAARRPVELWTGEETRNCFPRSFTAFQCNLSLPIYPCLTENQQNHIIKTVQKIISTTN